MFHRGPNTLQLLSFFFFQTICTVKESQAADSQMNCPTHHSVCGLRSWHQDKPHGNHVEVGPSTTCTNHFRHSLRYEMLVTLTIVSTICPSTKGSAMSSWTRSQEMVHITSTNFSKTCPPPPPPPSPLFSPLLPPPPPFPSAYPLKLSQKFTALTLTASVISSIICTPTISSTMDSEMHFLEMVFTISKHFHDLQPSIHRSHRRLHPHPKAASEQSGPFHRDHC